MNISRLLTALCCALALFASSKATAQAFPPTWASSSSYVAGDIVQYGGNWFRALKTVTPSTNSPAINYTNWELNFVRSNTTVLIGAGEAFPNLAYAWQYGHNARIADSAYLHYTIMATSEAFSENFSAGFSLDHGSGPLVSIIGNDMGDIGLNFPSTNGFVIDSNHSLASLSGVILTGIGGNTAIVASSGASLNLSDVTINGFSTGISEYQGATVNVSGFSNINCANGCYADSSGSIYLASQTVLQPTAESSGNGLYAAQNATIIAEGISIGAHHGYAKAVWAENNGSIDVSSANISDSTYGCYADWGGRITLSDAFPSQNTYDVDVLEGGTVFAGGTSLGATKKGTNDGSYIYAS